MSKEVLEQKIWHCVDMIADNANAMSDNRFGLDVDDMMCGIDECRHLLNRLETYLEQYEDQED